MIKRQRSFVQEKVMSAMCLSLRRELVEGLYVVERKPKIQKCLKKKKEKYDALCENGPVGSESRDRTLKVVIERCIVRPFNKDHVQSDQVVRQ